MAIWDPKKISGGLNPGPHPRGGRAHLTRGKGGSEWKGRKGKREGRARQGKAIK